jgi:hypothetical protein
LRSARYVSLTDSYGPDEQAYWAALVRAFPDALLSRAEARERIGDFAGAAHDMDEALALYSSLKDVRMPASYARDAIDHAILGETEKAQAALATARAQSDALSAEGRDPNIVAATGETLDFYAILDEARHGQIKAARIEFAGRSHWAYVQPSMLDRMADILRVGATKDEVIGTLVKPAGSFSAEARARRAKILADGGTDGKARYLAIRDLAPRNSFASFTSNLWSSGPSHYAAKTPDPKWQATMVDVLRTNTGVAAGYALLLDNAHTAQRLGKSRFQLMPFRRNVALSFVRFGNPGDLGISEDASYDAATVEAAIAPLFPRPKPPEPERASLH